MCSIGCERVEHRQRAARAERRGRQLDRRDDELGRTPRYFIVPWVTDPASWRWKMTYITSTGTTVMITAANSEPKSTA